jgi:hypothetical protein
MISLKAMSGLDPFRKLTGSRLQVLVDDILLYQTLAFVKQVAAVQNSGFTVEDLKYLLRHQFDPVGKYQSDPNALVGLVQAVAGGLRQIQAQNAVPDPANTRESLIDQSLSGLFPAAVLKTLFTQLTNAQTYTASAASAAALSPDDFASAPEVTLSHDDVTNTQTLRFRGLLLDWRKAELQRLNSKPALNALLSGLLDDVQAQARTALNQSIADVLGVWASLAQYEAVALGVPEISNTNQLTPADASLSLSYNQAAQLQWLGYRGVLTAAKLSTLTAINHSATLAGLLADVQNQALPSYKELTGLLLAMWCNVQTYKATQSGVTPTKQINVPAFFTTLAQEQQNGLITDPVPAIQITYDPATQLQTLTCSGVLTDSMRGKLAGLIPPSPQSTVLRALLKEVRDYAMAGFQLLAAGLFEPAITDLDNYVKPFLGVDPAEQQKLAKAELVKVFLPLLASKLSRQLVVQTLSANLGADASLTEALVTDAALLSDPGDPGKSLLQAFLGVGQPGVSGDYYDRNSALLASGIAATMDTAPVFLVEPADAANKVAGTVRCHFEGYLQAPTDGPYRFFAELGNAGAQAKFHLDSPDPAALFTDPIIQATATNDGDEASQFVQLKGGVAYHFTLDFWSLGAIGARMLVQGENLPKGPLSQLVLFPQEAIDAFARARVLLGKVTQILRVTGLDVREVSYLAEHAGDFNNLALSALPTQASDDSATKAAALFSQFLTLADYADLRKGPAGGTDGLIDVFQAALQAPTAAAALLANLTRRDPQVVQDVATALGTDPHFSNNVGIRRMWDALQLVHILGLPVKAISDSTAIVAATPSPQTIAANFKNAVKAQFTADQWRPIAQSVSDPLRMKKRDALVSYLVNALGLDSSNQLFEYFLVDPGMEPVVQTSRLRLALSSVQLFIQRCFLNLENGNTDPAKNVAPDAIPADWWPWMKRYRVWQANREIFLFPENWMEPELRLDKTDLFQALESALLQGDVTRDLVEDAFSDYLKGLDLRARLDIVASYFDQDATNPGESTLYVLGRTYGHPHKYFFRTYSNSVWSAWEAVTFDIEGDHIVLAVWRGRLNLFWLTFLAQAEAPDTGNNSFTDVSTKPISNVNPQKQVKVQLHRSEYARGKWSNRISTDLNKSEAINTWDDFDPKKVHVHVSKEVDSSGTEGAVKIHVDGLEQTYYQDERDDFPQPRTFRVTGKNCDPDFQPGYWEAPQQAPYNVSGLSPTEYPGSDSLTASFQSNVAPGGTGTLETENILDTLNNFALLTCGNPVVPPFLPLNDPDYQEAGGLVSPVFFMDTSNPNAGSQSQFHDERTYFVQPALTETAIQEWDGWAIPPAFPAENWADPNVLNQINVIAQVPTAGPVPISPGDPVYSVFRMQDFKDWITDPAVAIPYGGVAVGKNGGIRTAALAARSAVAGTRPAVTGVSGARAALPGMVVTGSEGAKLTQTQDVRTTQPVATGPGARAGRGKRRTRGRKGGA